MYKYFIKFTRTSLKVICLINNDFKILDYQNIDILVKQKITQHIKRCVPYQTQTRKTCILMFDLAKSKWIFVDTTDGPYL